MPRQTTKPATGTVRGMWAVALPAQPVRASPILPDWATPALRSLQGAPWPENQHHFALHVGDGDGAVGAFGPCSPAVIDLVRDQIAPVLVGQRVAAWRALEHLSAVGRHRSGAHFRLACSAAELALWDLRSRSCGQSITTLLGGPARDNVPAYASALAFDIDHPIAPDVARWLVEAGFWGQKWRLPGHDRGQEPARDVERLARLREAAGDEARIMVDAAHRWDASYARRVLPGLAKAGVTWVEEPCADLDTVVGPAAAAGVALAGGEHAYDPTEQLKLLNSTRYQVWQPDVAWHGGLAPALRTIELARLRGIPCFPHGTHLPATLHTAALTDAAMVPAVEYHLTLQPVREAVLRQPPPLRDGGFTLPGEPGLGASHHIDRSAEVLALGGDAHGG